MSPAARDVPPPDDGEPESPALPAIERALRVATYALPVFSVLVTALVLLGPGALHAVTAARVRGAPASGARAAALRVEVVRSFHDVIDAAAATELVVEATAPLQTLPAWRGAAAADGVADARLEASSPLRGPLAVSVTMGRRVLAAGEIALAPAAPAFVQLGTVRGATKGELAVRVDAARGVLASPFPETIRLTVTEAGLDAPLGRAAQIELSGAGIEVTPDRINTDDRGRASVQVKALAHNVELAISARAGEKTGRWEGVLPVVPGAMWIDPARRGAIAVVSPSPRERAYLSLWTNEGRVFGAVVPLARDGLGFFRGEVTAPPADGSVLIATVAGDPQEAGSAAVAWPIAPPEGAVSARQSLALLLDGLPAAIAREQQRAWAARRNGLALIGIAAVAEALLLLFASRVSQRRLEAHLRAASAASEGMEALPPEDRARLMHAARERPLLRAALGVALVALSFALIAALSTFR